MIGRDHIDQGFSAAEYHLDSDLMFKGLVRFEAFHMPQRELHAKDPNYDQNASEDPIILKEIIANAIWLLLDLTCFCGGSILHQFNLSLNAQSHIKKVMVVAILYVFVFGPLHYSKSFPKIHVERRYITSDVKLHTELHCKM